MIIDVTDFNNREYKVPNQEESRDFAAFLEKEEGTLAIKHLLGVELWEAFQDDIEGSDPSEFFIMLRDGGEYEYSNKVYRFDGWADLVRPALYSLWIPQGTVKFTNVGFVKNNAPQQSRVVEDSYPSEVEYWNKFVAKVGYQSGCGYNCKHTFYGFMKANEAEFDNWIFNCPTFKNRYDF